MDYYNDFTKILQKNDINIGRNIARLRKYADLRQNEMVARLQINGIDISVYSYNRVEKGKQNPTVSLLQAVCLILKCDFNDIFSSDNPE